MYESRDVHAQFSLEWIEEAKSKGLHLIKWKVIKRPVSLGGLEIENLRL